MDQNWMEFYQEAAQPEVILRTNSYTEQYGLSLTREDAEMLVTSRNLSLKEQRRVEFGQTIMPKIIYQFCDSEYIQESEYPTILAKLQDLFYLYKNEMQDEITDDELLHFMREQFDQTCFGDLEYLGGTCLEVFAQAIRAGYDDYEETDGYGVYHKLSPVKRWDYQLYLDALNNLF